MKEQCKFEQYFEEQIEACEWRGKLLIADDRMDEGNFERIKANVYEIFRTILSAADRVCGEDVLAKKRFFLEKAEQIPASWRTSYEMARQHEDDEKMHLESIKLDTVREIKDMCMRLWGEST